jgi:hypothetical protein
MKKINLCILKQNKKNRFFTTKDKNKDKKKPNMFKDTTEDIR